MEEINELAAALAKAQMDFSTVELDKINPHFKNRYASLASVQRATRPALARHGLSITQIPIQTTDGVMLETRLMHTSGQQLTSDWLIPKNDNIQKIGSYLSYVRRYTWASICGVAGEEDDDGEVAKTIKPSSKNKQTSPNGKPQHPTRPMGPAETRRYVASLVTYKQGAMSDPDAPASPPARGLFVGKLTEVFAPNDDADKMRRSVVTYLFNVTSSAELSKAQVSAGLDWLIERKDDETGEYILSPHSINEAREIERHVLMDAGQMELMGTEAQNTYTVTGGAA